MYLKFCKQIWYLQSQVVQYSGKEKKYKQKWIKLEGTTTSLPRETVFQPLKMRALNIDIIRTELSSNSVEDSSSENEEKYGKFQELVNISVSKSQQMPLDMYFNNSPLQLLLCDKIKMIF